VGLVRRALRAERVYEAHRIHACQWLARRWRSHGRVYLALLFLSLGWLFPCAAYAARHPTAAFAAVAVAPRYGPVAAREPHSEVECQLNDSYVVRQVAANCRLVQVDQLQSFTLAIRSDKGQHGT
jgi:hypothetical protein